MDQGALFLLLRSGAALPTAHHTPQSSGAPGVIEAVTSGTNAGNVSFVVLPAPGSSFQLRFAPPPVGTNPLLLPGDWGQQLPLRTTTRIEKAEGGDYEECGEYEQEERKKKETGQITAATQTKEEETSEKETAARGSAGAGWRKPFLVANTGDPKTTSSTKDATEVQYALHPISGHALERAWPL
ncbi:hypothetical protein NDU88_002611 [Pleurodeles waltl]|uniref:Uncharacterized protein n=1 Tax=Pleurodeles waltl TaxID=8319 RepID=A0AAV7VBP5_PLEWA|nr:hypothetical protein NDU88_002611 [Pleurodeles waltl]